MFIKEESEIDSSVNFVNKIDEKNAIECRFVHRDNSDYCIFYLSSQTGCRKSCRMCYLTATGQNKSRDCTIDELKDQFDILHFHYEEYKRHNPCLSGRIHVDFMARGEPLDSSVIVNSNHILFDYIKKREPEALFLISTIMPDSYSGRHLYRDFYSHKNSVKIYYSLYSSDFRFRKKWLPMSMDPRDALRELTDWSKVSGDRTKIHQALISGQNDSEEDAQSICDLIHQSGLYPDFNIVRYNAFSYKYGEESKNIDDYCDVLRSRFPSSTIIVKPRVGFDVNASCGMFV